MHGEIVLVAPGEFLFAADHARQIRELRDIAAASVELHGLRAFPVRAARLIEIEGEAAALQLLDLHAKVLVQQDCQIQQRKIKN